MQKLIVLQGVPASGKSTWAREFVKTHKDHVIVNRDSIREGRGEYWVPEQESYISDIEEFEIRAAIKRNLTPIIDATNLNPNTIKKWENLAAELNCEIEIKPFKIDYKTALERDSKRTRPVGEKVLKRFFKDYFPEEIIPFKDERTIIDFDESKKFVIICDIDGTIALRTNRSPYDLSKVGTDIFDPRMRKLLRRLSLSFDILFVSGREEKAREDTEEWIKSNLDDVYNWKLLMRKNNDFRSDDIVKKEIYDNEIKPNFNVVAAFDDRDRVVKMWRDEGILCCQVYYGDF